jgi:DNA-binding NarL/FixJ family response regulator
VALRRGAPVRRGGARRRTDLLVRVATAARKIGADDLSAKAESHARRARIPLDGVPTQDGGSERPEQRYGLTDRELEVLALLADGMTNREISEPLFMAEKPRASTCRASS